MDTPSGLPRLLVVDESRMVRALLVRHVRESYDFREEADGESAWQTLVLDHSIDLVICSLSLPVLDGDGLLQRVRASRLPRLARLPMLMISGDDRESIERARTHGASDFIDRSIGSAELLARVDSLLLLAQAQKRLLAEQDLHVQNASTGLFTRKYMELQALQALSHAVRHQSDVSAMVLCFDGVDALREQYGADVLEFLQQRFIAILAGKIRREDSLGHHVGSQLVVISPGTSPAGCVRFANRLRDAIQCATVQVHGRSVRMTMSAGVSSSPGDTISSAEALIALAANRLESAQQNGGNRVVSGQAGQPEAAEPSVERALSLLRVGRADAVAPHAASLARQLLPLFGVLERELALGLPLTELELRARGSSAVSAGTPPAVPTPPE